MRVYGEFRDKATYNVAEKSAISVRDGILEYLGSEIGYEPKDKMFKVYRSPATIANAAMLLNGIHLTDDHVCLDSEPANPRGQVLSSKMIDLNQPDLLTRIGILNTLRIEPDVQANLDAGKRELSLGYRATLVDAIEGSNFDLEQIEIIPHHLAVVDAGRCGSVCSFIDHKRFDKGTEHMKTTKKPLHKTFIDAEGNPSMTEIVAIVQALPEALAALPADEVMKLLPTLQEIVTKAGGTAKKEDEPALDDEAAKAAEAAKAKETPANDPAKEPVMDEAEKEKTKIADAKKITDASNAAVARHVEVMEKARQFLPSDYKFKDASTVQLMRDAVAVEHGTQKFSDSELDIAFKMLKKNQSQYRNFGDGAATGKFTNLADKTY